MGCTSKNSDAIATALREGLLDVTLLEPEGTREDIVSALIPVVEKLLAEQDKGWASWWALVFETGIPGSVVRDQFTREELRSHISERWDRIEARASEAEAALIKLTANIPKAEKELAKTATKHADRAAEAERRLAEAEKCIDVAVEQRDIIAAKCDEAERRLREIREHVDARLDLLSDYLPAAEELNGVLALLDTGAGQGEKT